MRLAVGGVADRPTARDWPRLDGSALDDALNELRLGSRRPRRPARDRPLPPRAGAAARPRGDRGGALMPRLNARARHVVRLHAERRAPSSVEVEPRTLLTDFLRHLLGATGTHVGCEHGVCGACTIADRRRRGARLPDARGAGRRLRRRARSRGWRRRPSGSRPCRTRLPAPPRAAMRLLHGRHPDVARRLSARAPRADRAGTARGSRRPSLPLHRLRADHRGRPGRGRHHAGGAGPCLTSAPASSPASSAIRRPRHRRRRSPPHLSRVVRDASRASSPPSTTSA